MEETRPNHAQVYQDEKGEYRWRLQAPNGEIIAVSGEGYVDKGHAKNMVLELFPDATHGLTEDDPLGGYPFTPEGVAPDDMVQKQDKDDPLGG